MDPDRLNQRMTEGGELEITVSLDLRGPGGLLAAPFFEGLMAERDGEDPSGWDVATRLVHGGSLRSSFGETAEAIFLTQGYIYDTAESADARFAGTEPGFIYSRYANPTVQMCSRTAWRCSRARKPAAHRRQGWRPCTWR